MSVDDYRPEPLRKLSSKDELRAYVNSTRITILALLRDSSATITQVAREIGTHPANLTHHFRILEKAKLIRLVEKRDTGRNLEKLYRAAALSFITAPGELAVVEKQALKLTILRDEFTASIQRLSKSRNEVEVFARLLVARISKQNLKKFQKKLILLVRDFEKAETSDGDPYSIALCLFPALVGNGPKRKIHL
jgi:DNA-binding transcriptional ArsR family regulator